MPASVAVIDIGSNSIKVLVAQRTPENRLICAKMKTIDARISAGISRAQPRLTDEGMSRGLAAIRELLHDAVEFQPIRVALVATSAVRDAANGHVFCERVQTETGHVVRILTGNEEANTIGRGLACDPALGELRDFYLFDLGGGSLECLAFRDRSITQAVSLPLGCVRLTERFVADSSLPFTSEEHQRIVDATQQTLVAGGFRFDLPPEAVAIGTGGTLTTARAILALRQGKSFEASGTIITVAELRELLAYIGCCGLAARLLLPAMPAARADVLPAALATVIAAAELGGFEAYRHSLYNLRWGVADELLPAD